MKVLYVMAEPGMISEDILAHVEIVKLAQTHKIEIVSAEQLKEMGNLVRMEMGMSLNSQRFEIPEEMLKVEIKEITRPYEKPIIKKNDHPFGKFIGNHKSKRGKNR